MSKMTQAEVESWDKQKAALHEAAHATVAVVLGVRGKVSIFPNSRPNISYGEKTWRGSFSFLLPLPAQPDAGTIAIAGAVADYMHDEDRGYGAPEEVAAEFWEYWSSGVVAPSDTDLDEMPDDEGDRFDCVRRAVIVLQEHRVVLNRITRDLLKFEFLSIGHLDKTAAEMLERSLPEEMSHE